MIWEPVEEGLEQLCRTIPQEILWPCECCTPPDSSQEGMTISSSSMHVVKQSTHLRSWQCCHFNVKIVDKVGNCFENISLDFNQSFMNCHLQVTVENFNELLEIEANIVRSKVEQCSSPPFT